MHLFLKPLALISGIALAACAVGQTPNNAGEEQAAGRSARPLMTWPDLLERPRPAPNHTIRYGDDPLQVVDLWLPEGAGPHPVAIMVHGGCWQTQIADRTIMNWIADDLRRRGIAVWNIDYRGVDRPGGGYPGTFQDAAAAADALRIHAARYGLQTDNLVAVGHSAGGHLALWLGARPKANQRARTLTVTGRLASPAMERTEVIARQLMSALEDMPGTTPIMSQAQPTEASARAAFPTREAATAAIAAARREAARLGLSEITVELDPPLPPGSPLIAENPIEIGAVVSLGGLQDLELAEQPPGSGCGTEVIARLTGGHFADTSLPRIAPLEIEQVLINGRQDRIIPMHFATSYAEKLAAVYETPRVRFFDRTGHVELIAPESEAWAAAVAEIRSGLFLQ